MGRADPADLRYSSYSRPRTVGQCSRADRGRRKGVRRPRECGPRRTMKVCRKEPRRHGWRPATPRRSSRRRRGGWWPPRAVFWRAAGSRRSPSKRSPPRRARIATRCATTSAARRPSSRRWSTRWRTIRALARASRRAGCRPAPSACRRLVAGDRRLVADRGAFRDFFAILPHVVLDEELRERGRGAVRWYRDLYVAGLDA